MQQEPELITYDGVVVPVSARVKLKRPDEYGHVPGLPDSELADPAELERWVMIQQWGPILALPTPKPHSVIRPEVDESGYLDWGAFGTIDFDRIRPSFNKARYKADRLREELKDAAIMLSIINERVRSQEKYLILKNLRMGLIDLDDIADEEMHALGKWYLRVRRISGELSQVRRARGRRWW